jgi:sugar/nucleoside kinase (ribokinase family)
VAPDYLVIGHVTRDVTPAGFAYGGTATFASLAAARLGRRAAVLTRTAEEPGLAAALDGVEIHRLPAEQTTTFENIYTPAGRIQYVRAVAPPIPADAVPPTWRTAKVVHLGPIAQEVPPEIADVFPRNSLIGATPQGWLRAWHHTGQVHHVPWENADRVLERVDVLIFSPEDVGYDLDLVRRYAEATRLAVVTEEQRGCTVWQGGRVTRYPAFEAQVVDPTGAGDVFAVAFFLRFAQTQDSADAARFANCASSFAIEASGASALPTLEMIETRLLSGKIIP